MSYVVKNTTAVAIEEESTEGTYQAPTGASSYVQTLADGFEMNGSKEVKERSVFSGSIGKVTPRTTTRSASGSVPVEFRANSTAGSAPEFDKLLKACLGTKRSISSTSTTKTGNTSTVLQIEDADISKYNIGDIILVKESGAYHVSPIIDKSTGTGTATITLLVAHPDGAMSDGVIIEKATVYTVAESGHPTLSITRYEESAVQTVHTGCRVTSMELSKFATGDIPELKMSYEGLDFSESLTAPSYSPSYDSALPPIALDAHAYLDGSEIDINELALTVENKVSFAGAFSRTNGKISSRITERTIKGTFNPYKQTDSLANYNKFVNNTEFSLFACAKNATSTAGEFQNIVAIYMPKCVITERAAGDAEGYVQENLSYSASRGAAGTTNEIYIAFI